MSQPESGVARAFRLQRLREAAHKRAAEERARESAMSDAFELMLDVRSADELPADVRDHLRALLCSKTC